MASFILGGKAKLYFSTTLLDGSNTATVLTGATEVGNVMDLTLNTEPEFVDATVREDAAAGFRTQVRVINNSELTFEMRWKPDGSDTAFDAFKDVAMGVTDEVCIIALDQDKATSGAQGLAANVTLGFSKVENIGDVQKVTVTMNASSYPEWYTVP